MARKKTPKTNSKTIGTVDGPWEPSEKQLAWYSAWTVEMKSQADIGRESKPPVGRSVVCESVHRVGEWMRQLHYEKVMSHRDRQTEIHENIARLAFIEYEKVQRTTTITTTAGGDGQGPVQVIKTEESTKNCQYLRTAMDALAAIRRIWSVDAPTKSEVSMHHEEIAGIPGMQGFGSRSEFLKAHSKAVAELAVQAEASELAAKIQAGEA